MITFKQVALTTALISVSSLLIVNSAFAHVVIKPAETISAGYQTFIVSAPNEKNIPTTQIKLLIPSSVESVTPTTKNGWTISTDKEGEGDAAKVTAITWSNGTIDAGFRDEFTFSAKAPAENTDLKWKAYQTYNDGTVVSWDKESDDTTMEENTGPLSITKVVSQPTAATTPVSSVNSSKAESNADRAFYTGLIGIATGLIAIFLATRRK